MKLEVVILAAGQGTRMKSSLPKVLHPLAGKPLLAHVVERATLLDARSVQVVIGHGSERVKQELAHYQPNWVLQAEQLGTGHAVAQALPYIADDSILLVLYGDVPLTSQETLQGLIAQASAQQLALLTVELENPRGYGRIVRDSQARVCAIVEEKDATDEQKTITEVNTGILAAPASKLKQWLPQLSAENAQGEYYLTDIIAMAVADGMTVAAQQAETEQEVEGVNSRVQLERLERWYQRRLAENLMDAGVGFADKSRVDIRGELSCGQDVYCDINLLVEGKVSIGNQVSIGPNVVIINSEIGDGVEILANTIIENARIASGCSIGPFARIRPGTELHEDAKVGNFVEVKNAVIGHGSKVNHLSYIGDAELGSQVNIGAGTITCNYDGANKHKTEIADNVFIGSNSALVAPIKIGKNATIGAGSTLSREVEENSLTLTRAATRVIQDWQRPQKKK